MPTIPLITDTRPMTDDEILAGLQKTMRRTVGWDGYLDDEAADRAEPLLQRAREALALARQSDLLYPNLPLAACPECSMYPDQIIGHTAEVLDVSLGFEGFRRSVRGLIVSITLDCGHELSGAQLGVWVDAACVMRAKTPEHWKAALDAATTAWNVEDKALHARLDRVTAKLAKARRRIRKLRQQKGASA